MSDFGRSVQRHQLNQKYESVVRQFSDEFEQASELRAFALAQTSRHRQAAPSTVSGAPCLHLRLEVNEEAA